MKRLSTKVIIALFAVIMLTQLYSPIAGFFIRHGKNAEIVGNPFFKVAIVTSTIITITMFAAIINIIIVKRIQILNRAMQEVANGNLNVQVAVDGRDELAQLTQKFNLMTRELKANEYLSKDFVRNFSHEFKTPLSGLRGYAELIEQETHDSAVKEYAQIIITQTDRLAKLSQGLLQLSLLDSTVTIGQRKSFFPCSQISSILVTAQFEIQQKQLIINVDSQEFEFCSNEGLLYQVWQNLISNAIKFTQPNGQIDISLTKTADGLQFSISDTGIGIQPEDMDRIFDLFVVADQNRAGGDSNGIGLTLTKKIVERLGGTVTVQSTYGQGTTFVVKISNSNHDIEGLM